MEIFYTGKTLYINIEERINFSLINKLQKKLYAILNNYQIENITLSILNNEHYDKTLLDELVSDYNIKYNGTFIIK